MDSASRSSLLSFCASCGFRSTLCLEPRAGFPLQSPDCPLRSRQEERKMKPIACCALVFCMPLVAANEPDQKGQTIVNHFDSGDGGWRIYDYNGGSGNQ